MDSKNEPKYVRGKYTEGQKEATARYQAKTYDDIKIRVKKGQKEHLKKIVEAHGVSLNAFIIDAIEQKCNKLGIKFNAFEKDKELGDK